MCGMKLLIHSQTSTVEPLKFENGLVISSCTFLYMWLLIHAGIKVKPSLSVEWSPASTGRVDADILNGSCDLWGSRDFLPYILYNLL